MQELMFIIAIICFIAMFFCIFMVCRIKKVTAFRISIIDYTATFTPTGEYWDRNAWFQELPSYESMLNRFWKPLSSFLKGTKYEKEFLEHSKNRSV